MKIYRFMALLIAVVTVVAFSGCSLNFFSVESLLLPPAQSGENGEIQIAFNKIMKDKTFQLKAPATGEFQSPFVLYDIDSDNSEEVLVFYSESNSEGSVRVLLMKDVDGEWQYCTDVKGAGNGIYDVNFVDVNNDSRPEVFISWTLMDSKTTRIVTVFQPQVAKNGHLDLVSLGNEYGVAKSFVDFNSDNKTDLCLIYIDDTGTSQKSYLRLFTLSDSKALVKYGEVPIEGNIQSVTQIINDVAFDGGKAYSRIFVDCMKNEKIVFTEMIYWDISSQTPVRAFADAAVSNSRNSLVACSDIDFDGLIEIPVLTTMYGNAEALSVVNEEGTHVFTMLKWSDVKGDTGDSSVLTLLNPVDGYLFKFIWDDTVTVKYDTLREALVFYEWNQDEGNLGGELFSLMYRSNSVTNEIPGELLRKDELGEYYYQITQNGKYFGITESVLNSSLITIN